MSARRVNPNAVKLHRSYSTGELAVCCDVHKNTVGNWRRDGLAVIDKSRPALFQGAAVRAFLRRRNARRKRPCPPGTLFCCRCREPRAPALGMVEYRPLRPASGNLSAICEVCEAIMHRGVRKADLAKILPNLKVQFVPAEQRLDGRTTPSPNCVTERQG